MVVANHYDFVSVSYVGQSRCLSNWKVGDHRIEVQTSSHAVAQDYYYCYYLTAGFACVAPLSVCFQSKAIKHLQNGKRFCFCHTGYVITQEKSHFQ